MDELEGLQLEQRSLWLMIPEPEQETIAKYMDVKSLGRTDSAIPVSSLIKVYGYFIFNMYKNTHLIDILSSPRLEPIEPALTFIALLVLRLGRLLLDPLLSLLLVSFRSPARSLPEISCRSHLAWAFSQKRHN